MQFGRVYGFVTHRTITGPWLTVLLDTGRDIRIVRDEAVPAFLVDQALPWLADQLVQETIGVDLSVEGWEVIGEDTGDSNREAENTAIGRSSVWILRRP
jgi:hypothetical protein